MKKEVYLLACFLIIVSYLDAQNLVPNPSFESDTSWYNNHITTAIPWNSPTNGSPDLYHTSFITFNGHVPTNGFGYQYPNTGNGYAGAGLYGFAAGGSSYYIEYLQVKLDTNLIANKSYCASFYLSLANVSKYAIRNIGMYFGNNFTFQPIYNANLIFTPQIVDTNFVTDTLNWVHFRGGFTAIGGERYLIIGNFNDSTHTDTMSVKQNGSYAYYYIDDVDVHLYNPETEPCCVCYSNIGIAEVSDEDGVKIYPNPNNGSMVLEYQIQTNDSGVLSIYDVSGRLVNQKTLNSANNKVNIDATSLNAGAYYYNILVNGNKVKADKLIILK